MSNIQSFRTPKRPPKKAHTQEPEAQRDTDEGDFVGGVGKVTPDSRSLRQIPSIIRTSKTEPDQLSQSGDPHPNLERSSSSSNTAEAAQNSTATIHFNSTTLAAYLRTCT